ncbi:MAG: hypothetical protein B6I31_00895 [Desulfobacteraceae bacterium 4572_19]|nr:MAG: hypothetical protein B6I31_00895 [Desulfobacteraceae bacterium 4572_19]
MQSLEIKEINADPSFNCRGVIVPLDVMPLATSIDTPTGLLEPIVVFEYKDVEKEETGFVYRLVCGFRRLMAHKVLKRTKIDAVIRSWMSEKEAKLVNVTENLQRQDLNILQEAKALKHLKMLGLSRDETAARLGKANGWVQVRYTLLELPEVVQEAAGAGFIKQQDIRALKTVQLKYGVSECIKAAKAVKKHKIAGYKIVHVPKPQNKVTKRVRKPYEIQNINAQLIDAFGTTLASRCLAWACGNITTSEMELTVNEYAKEHCIPFKGFKI